MGSVGVECPAQGDGKERERRALRKGFGTTGWRARGRHRKGSCLLSGVVFVYRFGRPKMVRAVGAGIAGCAWTRCRSSGYRMVDLVHRRGEA